MEALDKFNKMLGSIASQAGVVISSNAKVRSLHHRIAMEAIEKYKATPEDEETEKWLHHEALHQGLFAFDKQLAKLMDPYWEKIYIKEESID